MTREGGGGARKEAAEQGKAMGPLFPRLHVSDAGRAGGPRAPPRNKMALYEQLTVPSIRFTSPASAARATLVPYTPASQVYGYHRPLFQPFDVPSKESARSSEKFKEKSFDGQSNSTRRESGRLSSQNKNNVLYASRSIAECNSQHRASNIVKNSSGKKMANDDEFTVPSICSPRFSQHSTQEHAGVQDKSKHIERINVSDMRLMRSLKVKEKEPVLASKSVEIKEKNSSIQASKEKFRNKDSRVCQMREETSTINTSDNPLENSGHQPASMNRNSMKTLNPTPIKTTASFKPFTDLDKSYRNSNLPEGSLREAGSKRTRSLGHCDVEQNDDLSDSSLECMPGLDLSPGEIVSVIGQKHFWKARRAIQNQQRIFAVQVFELHRLIKVQKFIAASPHLLIEGDPCLGNALVDNNKLPKENLKVQTLSITNKDDTQPTLDQPELSKENSEGNPLSPSRDDGFDGNNQDEAGTNNSFRSNLPPMPAAPDNKQNNWCQNPPQNQWLVPVMSPSEGLVYKPYTGPCPPVGSLLTPFYPNCTPLTIPSTAYGVPMPHQPQHMAPPGASVMPMNYFQPFSMPVMDPGAPASAVERGSHASASQHNGHVEQQSLISCNMSHPSGIWRFHASRDSEPQASSASSPFDRLQGDRSCPLPFFPNTASVQNALPQPSFGSWDNQNNVIRVVPHNAQTASESAARIFQSIQMERQQNDS